MKQEKKTTMPLSKLHRDILEIIKAHPEAADDEHVLLAAIWRRNGWNDQHTLEQNLPYMTRAASVARRRRELHEAGLIVYSGTAQKKRTDAFNAERDRHSGWLSRLRRFL